MVPPNAKSQENEICKPSKNQNENMPIRKERETKKRENNFVETNLLHLKNETSAGTSMNLVRGKKRQRMNNENLIPNYAIDCLKVKANHDNYDDDSDDSDDLDKSNGPAKKNKLEIDLIKAHCENTTSPSDLCAIIVQTLLGFTPKFRPALSMPTSFFPEPKPENISSYTKEIVTLVNESDIPSLREIIKRPGITLNSYNRFGESVLHLACRRGFRDVVKFMLEEADGMVWIRDDCGRTPLHDACWSVKPDPEILDMLIRQDPALVFLTDKRGFSPFHYTRKEQWVVWKQFLFERMDMFAAHRATLEKYLS